MSPKNTQKSKASLAFAQKAKTYKKWIFCAKITYYRLETLAQINTFYIFRQFKASKCQIFQARSENNVQNKSQFYTKQPQ